MVVLDGVRYRKEDLAAIFPDRVKDAVEETVEVQPVFDKVTTAPGAVVTGADARGVAVVNTDNSAAGNKPVVVEEGGAVDGTTDVSGGADGSAAETAAGSTKRAGTRTGSAKGK